MTVGEIIAKRKRIWQEKNDIDYDRELVEASVRKILSEKSLVQEIRDKPYLLVEVAFCIVDKKRCTVPFFFNDVQQDFLRQLEEKGTSKPFFILKGRQQGFTSVITAIQLAYAITRKNFAGFTMADRADNSRSIFNDKARTVYDRLPEALKPTEKFNSVNELFFDRLNSSWRVATATAQVGRSRTLNFCHFSEVAFYDCSLSDLQAGIGQAITADAIVVYETTANGFNQAKNLWDSGSCNNLFYGWWQTAEYRSTEYQYIDTPDAFLSNRIKMMQEMGLDREQIAWYCKKYSEYLDKNLIRQEYPFTPEEAFVSSGGSVFDKETLQNQIIRLRSMPQGRRGEFEYRKICTPIYGSAGMSFSSCGIIDTSWSLSDIKFVEKADGMIILHSEPVKEYNKWGDITKLCPYVLGGDTAGTGLDYFTGKMIDNTTGKTVATLRKQRIDEDLYAEQMLCLAKYYNDALIAIETNYSRHPLRVIQKKYGYSNLYVRQRIDHITDQVEQVVGFNTTAQTKPIIIGELVEKMRSNPTIECDLETLREMTVFVKKDNGRQEAVDGEHDDLVMALAIAHFASTQQEHQMMDVPVPEDDFIADNFATGNNTEYMSWEDY